MTVLTILNGPDTALPASFDRLFSTAEVRVTTADQLAQALPGSEVLLMWDFFSTALRDAYPHADALQWIHAASAGVDSLLFPDLKASEITITNARGTFDTPIAEVVLGFILMLAKDMPRSAKLQREQVWQHRETELIAGTKALIVGTGAIGRATARLLTAVGITVLGAGTRARTGDDDFGTIIDSSQLARHVSEVDWLINIAPLTPATSKLIDATVFAALPEHARFINVGRGATADTDALVQALSTGQIAGAGLDVVEPEPLPAGHPLWDMDNVIITPHLSGDARGWRDRLADQFLANWDKFQAGQPLSNVVDKQLGYVPHSAS